MDLREFVKETLVQISMGVQDAITAHQAMEGAKGVINPVWGADASAISAEHAQKVEFDVAVTVTDKMGGSGKAGLKVFSLELGAEGRNRLSTARSAGSNSPSLLFRQSRS